MKILKRTIEYLLYSLAFLLPLQTRLILRSGEINGGYFEYGTYSLYLTDIVLIFIIVLFALQGISFGRFLISRTRELKITNCEWRLVFILGFLDLFIFISCFFAYNKLLAFYKYGWFLLGLILLFLLIKAKYNRIKFFYFFLGGIVLQSLLAIYQVIFQLSFENKWLGIANHNPGELGTSVIEILNGERWLRAYGGLDHPNILGGLLVISILFLLINKNFKFSLNAPKLNLKFLGQNALLIILITALFLTFSRGAYLALTFSFVLILIFSFYKKDKEMRFKSLKFILTSFLIFVTLFLIYPNLFQARILGNSRLENKSNIERISGLRDAQKIIKNNFLFGVGIGNYTLALKEELYPNEKSYFYQPVHNVFLLILAEIGIFGLISFLFFLVYFFFKISKDNIYNLSLLFALIIMFSFDHYYLSLHFGFLLFFFILGGMPREHKVS